MPEFQKNSYFGQCHIQPVYMYTACIYVWAVGDQGEQMANHLGQEQPVWAEGGQGEQRRVTQLPSLLIMLIC